MLPHLPGNAGSPFITAIFCLAFALVEELCRKNGLRYLRCDTDEQNKRMQHVFKKNGFSYCGIIDYFGDGKLAFDKLLDR